MNRTVLHNLVEAYQEARHWKLQAEGLQHKFANVTGRKRALSSKGTDLGARPIRLEI